MEQSKNYKALCDLISQFEKQLHPIDYVEQQQNFNLMRRRIEEHFERYIHALEARQDLLLDELDELALQHWEKTEKIQNQIKQYVQDCTTVLTTGSQLYSNSAGSADLIWQAALDLPKPSVSIYEIKADITITLPDNLRDIIGSHGTVNIPATNPPIELASVSAVSIPASTSSNVNFERFTVVDTISTIAEGKLEGYADETGTNTRFWDPSGICFNPNDDCFYVCDYKNHAIRRVTLKGSVSTLVQTENIFNPRGIVVCVKENCLFVTCAYGVINISMKSKITQFAGSVIGYKDGDGLHASFNWPDGIAIEFHSGSLFVADSLNHVIRLISSQGKVSTFAGSTQGFADGHTTKAKFYHPRGLCIDVVDQSLLVCDYGNYKIRRISHSGDVSTVCTITMPCNVAITANGVILVSSLEYKIYKVTKQATGAYKVDVLAGTEKGHLDGKASNCKFTYPEGIVVHEPSHSCFITDWHSIRKIDFL